MREIWPRMATSSCAVRCALFAIRLDSHIAWIDRAWLSMLRAHVVSIPRMALPALVGGNWIGLRSRHCMGWMGSVFISVVCCGLIHSTSLDESGHQITNNAVVELVVFFLLLLVAAGHLVHHVPDLLR